MDLEVEAFDQASVRDSNYQYYFVVIFQTPAGTTKLKIRAALFYTVEFVAFFLKQSLKYSALLHPKQGFLKHLQCNQGLKHRLVAKQKRHLLELRTIYSQAFPKILIG